MKITLGTNYVMIHQIITLNVNLFQMQVLVSLERVCGLLGEEEED